MRSRLNVYVSKLGSVKYHPVCDTVEGDTASKTHGFLSCLLLNKIQKREIVFFKHRLYRRCKITVLLQNFGAWNPGRTEDLLHFRREKLLESWLAGVPAHVDAIGVMSEIIKIETTLITVSFHDVADLRDKTGLAISRETHHLVLVSIFGEAKKRVKAGLK